jgi:lysophospholipase L1-like esterase
MPACNYVYPTPNNDNVIRLAFNTTITSKDTITFFGDSITWINGYISLMQQQLAANNIFPKLVNRGVNGAKIKDVRDGCAGGVDFDTALEEDQPTIVNIMIGINDVWDPTGATASNSTEFESILIDLVGRVQKIKALIAVSTVSVIGEKIDGSNGYDDNLNIYANVTRSVGKQMNIPVSDVHTAYMDYLYAYNTVPLGVGLYSGTLTNDGVHPCEGEGIYPADTNGNVLLADVISSGLIEALATRAN